MSSHSLIRSLSNFEFLHGSSIVEIGCVRDRSEFESGTSSTHFFSQLALLLPDVNFFSVDFSSEAFTLSRAVLDTFEGSNLHAIESDGKKFLEEFDLALKIGCLYLDNFDVIYNDKHKESLMRRVGNAYELHKEKITNARSAEVHLEQVLAAERHLAPKHVIIFDDSKIMEGKWWGKGALAIPYLLEKDYKIFTQSDDGVLLTSPKF